MTHGHELRVRVVGGNGGVPDRGRQRGKNWDNCNSMINKIYLNMCYSSGKKVFIDFSNS